MNTIKFFSIFLFAVLSAACGGANVSQNTATTPASAPAANNAAAAPTQTPDELAAARAIYSKSCVNCHRETGEGGVKEFEGEKIKVPNYKDPRVAAEPDVEYIEHIEKGGDGMPAYKGKLTDEEIKNLVRFIRREFQGK